MAEKKKSDKDLDLPDLEEAQFKGQQVSKLLSSAKIQDLLPRLNMLRKSPPQVLLLESGTKEIRKALALYWACLLNCTQMDNESQKACLSCQSCLEILNTLSADFFFYDCDLERLKIDDVRTLKPSIALKPNFLKQRIALFYEPVFNRSEAANAMLKILEEPNNTTSFIFTVSQRQSMLPTIVSRSFVLTLPSQSHRELTQEEIDIRQALYVFFTTGKEWFNLYTFVKGFNIHHANMVLFVLSQSLAKALAYNTNQKDQHALVDLFYKKIDAKKSFEFNHYLEEAQNALFATVNPALVTDSLLLQIFMLLYSKD